MKLIGVIAAALLLAACAAPVRIPDGIYGDGRGGTLTVRADRIEFQVPEVDSNYLNRCTYRLSPSGTLQLGGSSNSPSYVFFVLDRNWRWTGTAIESRDRRDGTVVTYAPVQ
ncbi:MAG TPA: hypothetical protein VFS23_29085 [Vicinamibacterales bacterium]|nr:hypothetical protein [Vicinamibacterales bacterium]